MRADIRYLTKTQNFNNFADIKQVSNNSNSGNFSYSSSLNSNSIRQCNLISSNKFNQAGQIQTNVNSNLNVNANNINLNLNRTPTNDNNFKDQKYGQFSKNSHKKVNETQTINNITQIQQQQRNEYECSSCNKNAYEKQNILKFMKEQIQISCKQYKEKMNKILKEQAKQIIQLKVKLEKNSSTLKEAFNFNLNMEKASGKFPLDKLNINLAIAENLDYSSHSNRKNSQNSHMKQKTSPLRLQKKSPSKLSLTKSPSSSSVLGMQKQKTSKISILSKQLSPIKTNQNGINCKGLGTSNLTEVVRKIKQIQNKLALTFEYQNERTEKFHVLNKHLQIIQNGLLKLFACKIKKSSETLTHFLSFQQNKIKLIQQDLVKCITIVKSSQNSQSISSQYHPTILTKTLSDDAFMKSKANNQKNVKSLMTSMSLQLQQLKQLSKQIKTKEFKYDNYQMDTLIRFLDDLSKNVNKLEREKQLTSKKMIMIKEQNQRFRQQKSINVMPQKLYPTLIKNDNLVKTKKEILALAVSQNLQNLQFLSKSTQNYHNYQNAPQQFDSFSINNFMNNKSLNLNEHNKRIQQPHLHPNSYSQFQLLNSNSNNKDPSTNTNTFNKNKKDIHFNNYSQHSGLAVNSMNQNQNKGEFSDSEQQQNYQHCSESFADLDQQEQEQKKQDKMDYNNDNDGDNSNGNCDDDDEFFYPAEQSYISSNQNESYIKYNQNQSFISQNSNNSYYYPKSQSQSHQYQHPHLQLYQNHAQTYNQNIVENANIDRFMDIFNYRSSLLNEDSQRMINSISSLSKKSNNNSINNNNNSIKPIHIEIDQTGYIKCSENGMYIVDRNGDGFQLQQDQLNYLEENGFIRL